MVICQIRHQCFPPPKFPSIQYKAMYLDVSVEILNVASNTTPMFYFMKLLYLNICILIKDILLLLHMLLSVQLKSIKMNHNSAS